MNKTLTVRAALLLGLLLIAGPLFAQTAINSTTLSANVTATQTNVQVASVSCTNCGTAYANWILYIDGEAMCVASTWNGSSTTVPVTRGCLSTPATPHLAVANSVSKVVYLGPANRFHSGAGLTGDPPIGSCNPRSQWGFLPWINISTGTVGICDGMDWRRIFDYNLNGTAASR